MTTAQVTDPDTGSRYYTIRDQQYWSVTTALSIINKDNLPYWAAGLAATGAFEQLPAVITAARVKPCGNTYMQCRAGRGPNAHDWRIRCTTCPCDRCRTCLTHQLVQRHIKVRDTRADEGRRTHDVIEQWVLTGGKIAPHDDDIKPYVASFLAFTAEYGLQPDSWHFAEATLVNHAERYAGTTDGVILFQCNTDPATNLIAKLHQLPAEQCKEQDLRASVVVDFKTKEKTVADRGGFYPGLALQLVGYRRAEAVLIGETEEPMPATQGAMGVQLRLDGAVPRLCVTDEVSYAAFLCALNLYRWHVDAGTASVSERSFKVPAAVVPAAKATTRAPRKTAAKASAGAAPSTAGPAAKSAVMASLARLAAPSADAHPDSPYGDDIPF